MNFPSLYKKNNNGKILYWNINVSIDSSVTINTSYGQLNGKIQTNSKEVTNTRSKDTVEKQAIFMATKQWNDKKNKDLYVEDLVDLDKSINKNTHAYDIHHTFRPHLAKTFNDKTKLKFPVSCQPKFDGSRGIMYTENGDILMDTRQGITYNSNNVQYLTKYMKEFLKPNLILDGEIFDPSKSFNELQTVLKTQKPKDTDLFDKKFRELKFYVFDLIDLDNLHYTSNERYTVLNELFNTITESSIDKSNIILVNNRVADSKKDIDIYHNEYVKEGHEGLIIRKTEGKYGINKRNSDLLKLKFFHDDEFEIIGADKEIRNGVESVVWICHTKDKSNKFNCRPEGKLDYRVNLLLNKDKYIGQYLTVKYQELGDSGIPRFPIGKGIRIEKLT